MPSSHNLHKIPNTFTRRTLKIHTNSPFLLQKFNLKCLYIKNLHIAANNLNNFLKNLHEQRLNKTLLKTLHKAQIFTCRRLYFLQAIKPVKTLKQATFQFSSESVKAHFPTYLKKMPKYIKAVAVDPRIKSDKSKMLYRNLARLPYLERLTRKINGSQNNEDLGFMKEESKNIKQYLPRMSRLKDYKYSQGGNHQYELQSLLQRENKVWPWLTMLSLHLKLPEINVLLDQIPDEEETVKNKASPGKPEPDRVPALFKYSLFPNLKHLHLTLEPSLNIQLPRSVIKEFQALRNLRSISFDFKARPRGTTFLLLGLLELPPLDNFTLNIPFLSEQDWSSLYDFFQKQLKLSLVHLEISTKRPSKSTYLAQGNHIKNLLAFLQNKPHLKTLRLVFPWVSLQTISTAFSHQIISLDILKIYAFEGPEGNPKDDIKRLCEFLRNQKGNLRSLDLSLGYLVSIEIFIVMLETISELKELRELKLNVNSDNMVRIDDYEKYYEKISEEKGKKGEGFGRWKSSLVRAIGRLEKIETLVLRIDGLEDDSQGENWCLGLLKAVGGCERLRKFVFGVPVPGKDLGVMEEVGRILGGFKKVDVKFEAQGRAIDPLAMICVAKATAKVSCEKSLNTELMFY